MMMKSDKNMGDPIRKQNISEYIKTYLDYYKKVVDQDYPHLLPVRNENALDLSILPLYDRKLGKDVALLAFYTDSGLYIYFIRKQKTIFEKIVFADNDTEFNGEPFTLKTYEQKEDIIKKNVSAGAKYGNPYIGSIVIPGRIPIDNKASLIKLGKSSGAQKAHQDAKVAAKQILQIDMIYEELGVKIGFKNEYIALRSLRKSTISKQKRGVEFEKLIRNLLDFYGWNTKEIKKTGEQIDFTAIFEGNHIIGEIRWFTESIEAKEMGKA